LLENWPVLAKEELRRNPAAFLADDCRPSRMFVTHTSGTTGTPLRLYESRAAIRAWYALVEARWRRWYGLSRQDRWAILGGQLVTPAAQRTPPFWVRNRALNQLYLSAYHLAPELIPHYVKALREFAPVYLLGYSSALHTLAGECLRQGVKDLRFKTVLTNAEPLYAHQRETIAQAFQCPVRETYGMSEKAAGASECEHGRLHWWPDAGVAEIESPDETGAGELLVTGLLNRDMPLIRYRVGDRARLAQKNGSCACGRSLPVMESIEGRSDDVLLTPEGRRIGRLDPVFKGDLGIREAQIVQEELDRVRVTVVAAGRFGGREQEQLRALLSARLGPAMRIEIESAAAIPRGANGKFRAVISRLPAGSVLRRT
jgi:phenylacetate-CoA ligase